MPESPLRNYDAIICDGAVRSGKTLCMSVSFVAWAFSAFSDCSFAMCGKTIASLRRNVVTVILPLLRELGFDCCEKYSQNLIEIPLYTLIRHTSAPLLQVYENMILSPFLIV